MNCFFTSDFVRKNYGRRSIYVDLRNICENNGINVSAAFHSIKIFTSRITKFDVNIYGEAFI